MRRRINGKRYTIRPEANLQEANLQEANLQEAYLQGANLQEAYLQGANLQEANLQGAYLDDRTTIQGFLTISPIGSRGDTLIVWLVQVYGAYEDRWYQTGCFLGHERAFLNAVDTEHRSNRHQAAYKLAITLAQHQLGGSNVV